MLIKIKKGWELPDRMVTPEQVALDRRAFLVGAAGAAGLAIAAPSVVRAQEKDPTAHLYPGKRNERFKAGRAVTPEEINSAYNNFYEFGSHKEIAKAAQALKVRPWTLKVDGLVAKPFEIDMDDLVKKMPLEERVYRHRCVETWSMIVPWSGFALKSLVEFCKPVGDPKYIVMQTLLNLFRNAKEAAAPAEHLATHKAQTEALARDIANCPALPADVAAHVSEVVEQLQMILVLEKDDIDYVFGDVEPFVVDARVELDGALLAAGCPRG